MFDHWETSDVLFLFIEMTALTNSAKDEHIRQPLINDPYPMSFFSSSKADDWQISLIMITVANVWSFTNIRCRFTLDADDTIEQLLLGGLDSPMFDDLLISDVVFLFNQMRSLNNLSYHHNIRHWLIILHHAMSFFYSWRWDHWKISLKIIIFANPWSLTNIRCPFSLHSDHVIEQFLEPWTHSRMLDHSTTSDLFFLFFEIRSLNNFSENEDIRQCLIIDQRSMLFSSSSRSDHWSISLIIITFANASPLINIQCAFSIPRQQIIEQFLLPRKHSRMLNHWPTSDVLFSSSRWDHGKISLIIIAFANVSSMTDIRCPFSLPPVQIM